MPSVTASSKAPSGTSFTRAHKGFDRRRRGYGSGMTVDAHEGSEERAAEGFGTTSRKKVALLYGGLVAVALVVLQLILMAGRHLHAPKAGKGALASSQATEEIFWRLLLAALIVIVVSRAVGALFRRINQPQVVGEIAAGILLGPSVLGALWPQATAYVFSPKVLPFLDVLAEVGLIFFMFLIGLELDTRLIRGRGHAAALVSHVSIIFPFLLGVGSALVLFSQLGSSSGKFTPFALFLGASMSITAFPVLARILTERGLYKTRLGAVTLTCAAVDDVTAWCILAVVVTVARASGMSAALLTIGLSIIFIAFMIVVVRPLMARLAVHHEEHGQLSGWALAIVFGGVLLSAIATDRIGIHAIFGAFLFGAVMPQRSEFIRELVGKLEDFVAVFLLPLFFAYTGLRTQIGLIGGNPKLWLFCGLILLVAVLGKWGGSTAAAKAVGLHWRESLAVGILMNTRGLTELIILNIGLDLGVIPPTLFAMLVIMALVTTFMTTPLLSLVYPRAEQERMVAEEGGEGEGEDEEDQRKWRVLIPIPSAAEGHELVHMALRLARDHEEDTELILLRPVRLPGSAYRSGHLSTEATVAKAMEALRPLVQMVEGAGARAVALATPGSPGDTVVRVAEERRPNLVLMFWREAPFARRLLGGTVGHVLRNAGSDVAVLIDPAHQGVRLKREAEIAVPFGGGFHEEAAIDLALRLAEASGATLKLVGRADDAAAAHDLSERAAQAYETTGVWTVAAPITGDVTDRLVEQAQEADVVVMGVSDKWVRDQHSLGELRESVAARASAPVLVVRRQGQPGQRGPSRWLRRQREWLDDRPSASDEAVDALTG
jgi:Kef-type K+ transport system membrane component KefB/nucleotide-binding universal stress UspA family protein